MKTATFRLRRTRLFCKRHAFERIVEKKSVKFGVPQLWSFRSPVGDFVFHAGYRGLGAAGEGHVEDCCVQRGSSLAHIAK